MGKTISWGEVHMDVKVPAKRTEEILQAIFELDLEPIKTKLMDPEEGKGWSAQEVDFYETEYKRFLSLVVKYPEHTIAPNREVDAFWHAHILDTMKYAEDCRNVFGYFLHHYPYFGLRGEEDAANLAEAFATMQSLREKEYGGKSGTLAVRDEIEISGEQGAFCGVAKPVADKEAAAFCGVAKPLAEKEAAAFCGVAKPLVEKEAAAFCGVAKPLVDKEAAAFCGVAKPLADKEAVPYM
jgi:hypothetical protein